ncbi:hypothetical protein, partial [Roseivivax isoporae]|uniref:hypothetical protein n=1 Tax=Roseivivax isoporae TaxID=591206 RepID=UPI001B7FCC9E
MFSPVEEIGVTCDGVRRRVVLALGDLARIDPGEAVDLLVISALPGDYMPTDGSLVGQLVRQGVSVAALARDKARDLTATTGAWLSQPVAGAGFGRLVCFEPARIGPPPQVVGQLFRALFPFLEDMRDQVVAMPVPATGDAGWPPEAVMPPLLEAAVEWLRLGLPVATLWIVVRDGAQLARVRGAFAAERARQAAEAFPGVAAPSPAPMPEAPRTAARRARPVAGALGAGLAVAALAVAIVPGVFTSPPLPDAGQVVPPVALPEIARFDGSWLWAAVLPALAVLAVIAWL